MQEPRVNPLEINPDDPLLNPSKANPDTSAQPGLTEYVVTVDGSPRKFYARDKAHLMQVLKAEFPKGKIDLSGEGRSVTGKKANRWQRKKMGGGSDPLPPMNKKDAAKLNQQNQKKINQARRGNIKK